MENCPESISLINVAYCITKNNKNNDIFNNLFDKIN